MYLVKWIKGRETRRRKKGERGAKKEKGEIICKGFKLREALFWMPNVAKLMPGSCGTGEGLVTSALWKVTTTKCFRWEWNETRFSVERWQKQTSCSVQLENCCRGDFDVRTAENRLSERLSFFSHVFMCLGFGFLNAPHAHVGGDRATRQVRRERVRTTRPLWPPSDDSSSRGIIISQSVYVKSVYEP